LNGSETYIVSSQEPGFEGGRKAHAAVAANTSVLFAPVSLATHNENNTVKVAISPSLALIEPISYNTTTGATISKAASVVANIDAAFKINESL
jgi:hypothetical protein